MAEDRDAKQLFWVEPQSAGVFPLDRLIVSQSLAKTVRSDRFEVVADGDFAAVMRACAERDKTWINAEILRLYCELHRRAATPIRSKSTQDGELVGGLYGVGLGAAFFGESMFHRARDASKVALVHLVARLRTRRLPSARHAVPDRRIWRASARSRSRAPTIGCGSRRRCESDGRFRRLACRRQAMSRRRGARARPQVGMEPCKSGVTRLRTFG